MFVNSISVDIVRGAYQIAANYLTRKGFMSYDLEIHQPLRDQIIEAYRAGNRNQLRLANRAIERMETAMRDVEPLER